MKRFTLVLALVTMMVVPVFAERVTSETARKVASSFLNNNGAKSNQLVDLSKAAGFPNLYIFSGEEGFVVMSADDCVKPILGYSLTGKFVAEDMPENVNSWLQGYNDEIQYAIENGVKSTAEGKQVWNDLIQGKAGAFRTTAVVEALVKTTWDQHTPYNNLCPYDSDDNKKTLTGCVATAMAQIMNYWKFPSQGLGSHSYIPSNHPKHGVQFANFGATTYDWNNMLNSYSGSSYSDTQANAVATLMYHCGVSVDMDYDYSQTQTSHIGSSASTYNVMYALENYFNYAPCMHYESKVSHSEEEWITMLKQELDNKRPLQYRGSKTTGGGHSFVCDGYDNRNYFHFNWGWSGFYNGFYSVETLCSEAAYTKDQEAIFGIQPISGNQHPTNLVANVSGRNVGLTWDGFEGASSYKVYCDYNLIGNTTSCSFNDTKACIGTHSYFVRGVKNDSVTLPSNIATATVTFGGTTEELKIEYLQATYDNGNVTLEWTTPYRLNYLDYHSFDEEWTYTGTGAEETIFWGARFPASMLSPDTKLTSVSYLFNAEGQYTTYIYQCTGGIPSGTPIITMTENYPIGWNNIVFPTSITIDPDLDLWIVFKSTDIPNPLTLAEYNADDGNYYSINGNNWYHVKGYSYFISANLSDGTFTYNIYDDNTKIASSLTTPNHTLSNIGLNVAHQYSVKAQKGETVAEASNMIGFTRGTASISSLNLGDKDQMTVTNSSTLTVGTLINTNPDNLILENGAQLISNSTEVMATVMKAIKGYKTIDNKGNWYLIASPMTEQLDIVNSTNLLTTNATDYDLYIFDQSNETEWLNYKQNHFTTIDNKTGYLYANKDDINIAFVGTLNNTNGIVTIAYIDDQEHSGFNLVGNPFPCNATISRDFYRIVETVEGSKILIATDPTIAPMEGVFVKAIDSNDSITFSKPTAKECHTSESAITMSVGHGQDGVLDIARIRFSGETNLEKLSLREGGTELFIPQNGKKFALVVNPELSETPISFKAATDGTYTLTVSSPPTSYLSPLTYLHLIDNLTGTDTDLLQNQSYTFEAKADDFESRFRLLFSATDNPYNDSTDIEGGVTHVMDVTGRIIGTSIHEHLKPGVYILRTVNGNDIKTEKIIIK